MQYDRRAARLKSQRMKECDLKPQRSAPICAPALVWATATAYAEKGSATIGGKCARDEGRRKVSAEGATKPPGAGDLRDFRRPLLAARPASLRSLPSGLGDARGGRRADR